MKVAPPAGPPPSPTPILGRPPERVTVTVYFKMALSTAPEIETVTWPKNWPFPQHGDSIAIRDKRGIIVSLHFEPIENRLVVNTR